MSGKKQARQARIVAELAHSPALRTGALARRLGVSAETIRRDLDALTREGLIARTYGGAMRRLSDEPTLAERLRTREAEREAIAAAACARIAGARHIAIGSGSTTVHVARRLAAEARPLAAVVHSFDVAAALAAGPNATVTVCPGHFDPGEGATTGATTLAFLERLHVDWAVLGASGLSEEGPSDTTLASGEVYAAMGRRAARRIVVADATKIGAAYPSAWARWAEIDVLVIDAAPQGAFARALVQAGVDVVLAALAPRRAAE